MKPITTLALFLAVPLAMAQGGPPPGMPPSGQSGGQSRGTSSQTASSRNSGASAATLSTETIRLLNLSSVEHALVLTTTEMSSLSSAVRALSATATEEQAFTAVAKVLTSEQNTKLVSYLITDLGYSSLQLSSVRSQLTLTAEQEQQIEDIVSTQNAARTALITGSTNASAAQSALAAMKTKTDATLAKILTSDQDTKLKSLAGHL